MTFDKENEMLKFLSLFGRKTMKQPAISKDGRIEVGAFFPHDPLSIDECEERGWFKVAAVKAEKVGDIERAVSLFEKGGYLFLAAKCYHEAGLKEKADEMYKRAVQQHNSLGMSIDPLDLCEERTVIKKFFHQRFPRLDKMFHPFESDYQRYARHLQTEDPEEYQKTMERYEDQKAKFFRSVRDRMGERPRFGP